MKLPEGWHKIEKGFYSNDDVGSICHEGDRFWYFRPTAEIRKTTLHATLQKALTASQQSVASDAARG